MLGKTRNKSISLTKNNTEVAGNVTIQDMMLHQHSVAAVQNESIHSRKNPAQTKSQSPSALKATSANVIGTTLGAKLSQPLKMLQKAAHN